MITRITALLAFTGTLAAQTVVVGTGRPEIDVPAVQAAVDRGGAIVLKGHFSFDKPPVMHGMLPDMMATVLVSREVTISGTWDDDGEMTSIQGGETPFAIEAAESQVRIERLRFVRPKGTVILADAARSLAIESCVIEDVEPAPRVRDPLGTPYGIGIYIGSLIGFPNRDRPGQPENISGTLSIVNNQITINGGSEDHGMGIMIISAGTAEKPVDVEISGNTIRNASKKGINVRQIGGRARIERNVLTSGVVYTGHAHGNLTIGIICAGSGSYRIAHNRIDYADPDAAGIRLHSMEGMNSAIEHATVVDNDVTLSSPEGTVFGGNNAGIELRGLARENIVQGNRIRGRGRAALVQVPDNMGIPAGNTFDRNDQEEFIAARSSK